MARSFARFAAVDWSGAVGPRQKGIAIAICDQGRMSPVLVRPGHTWSRSEALDWVLDAGSEADTLIGFDLSPALPFLDERAYFPDWDQSPASARELWTFVERLTEADPHLSASSFVDHAEASRHFRRHGGRRGDRFPAGAGRLRQVEIASREQCIVNPYSCFNLVGAAQVGKSSLTGMRVFHRLSGRTAIWPFDPVPDTGSLIVEIYTSIAAAAAGRPKGRTKIRDQAALDAALSALRSDPSVPLHSYDDHATDAIITAAWLRIAADDDRLWRPAKMTEEVARTEGWTFGIP